LDNSTLQFVLVAPILLFSVVAHEYAHGWVAYKNGDPTAYQLGRLTWNPIKHIDPVMTIILPTLMALSNLPILGGAKPVPVDPRRYRHFKRGDIQVSLAGIVTNLIIACLCTLLIVPLSWIGRGVPGTQHAVAILQHMFVLGINVNLVLAMFNLLPLPPLDGSHVMKYLLPPAWSLAYQRLGRSGLVILYALLFLLPGVLTLWLTPAYILSSALFRSVASFIFPWPYAA
jgi:Zn-dependent protease